MSTQAPTPHLVSVQLLRAIAVVQTEGGTESPVIRTAIVTARNSPAHERVVRTLRVYI